MADIKLNIKANTSGLKSQLDGLFKGAFSDISGVAKGGGGFGIGKMLGRGSVVVGALMGIKSVMSRVLGKLTESSAILQANLMIAKQAVRIALKPFGDLLGTLLRPFLMWGLKVAIAINKLLGGEEGQDFMKDKLITTGELTDAEMLVFDECEKHKDIEVAKSAKKVDRYRGMWKRRFIN